ncbi:hypothetical protein AK812_SmicGene32961 [Symbiodinium microadriaticum]|uniref:Uncharacterized protein n=1 Tax=Symbiodinium microadriaticum TaxID=2951 RepID=A0A1Q9CSW9_SYMMI|nr:hypothetical protein AK812_SmicGene32961 [Symbiodinium microadriaticum]
MLRLRNLTDRREGGTGTGHHSASQNHNHVTIIINIIFITTSSTTFLQQLKRATAYNTIVVCISNIINNTFSTIIIMIPIVVASVTIIINIVLRRASSITNVKSPKQNDKQLSDPTGERHRTLDWLGSHAEYSIRKCTILPWINSIIVNFTNISIAIFTHHQRQQQDCH